MPYQIWPRVCSSKDSMTIRLSFNIPNEDLIIVDLQVMEPQNQEIR